MKISEQIFPRVVALICTSNKEGRPITKKYSFENLKEVPEFTLNILTKEIYVVAKNLK